MTSYTHYIAGDWGTSNLRLYLCKVQDDAGSALVETRFGPGVSQIEHDFEEKFFSLAQDWFEQHGKMPVLLSGMIGSTIGWKEAPYLECPVGVNRIAEGRLSFTARGVDFSILAGLKSQNPFNLPDLMRGEELQMLGWMQHQTEDVSRRLFALPGTHNKWTLMENNRIANFMTAFTGELYALLRNNSILITHQNTISFNREAFMQGVKACEQAGDAQVLHLLFSTRSRQVLGEMPSTDALAYLSGLITATDVIGALRCFKESEAVTIIGETTLCEHYQTVLTHLGLNSDTCAPADIAIAGFNTIYQRLYA